MAVFFAEQVDFILFFYGLAFILLGFTGFAIARQPSSMPVLVVAWIVCAGPWRKRVAESGRVGSGRHPSICRAAHHRADRLVLFADGICSAGIKAARLLGPRMVDLCSIDIARRAWRSSRRLERGKRSGPLCHRVRRRIGRKLYLRPPRQRVFRRRATVRECGCRGVGSLWHRGRAHCPACRFLAGGYTEPAMVPDHDWRADPAHSRCARLLHCRVDLGDLGAKSYPRRILRALHEVLAQTIRRNPRRHDGNSASRVGADRLLRPRAQAALGKRNARRPRIAGHEPVK